MLFDSRPSGSCPVSLIIRTVSPVKKVWFAVNVITFDAPPSLNTPILLIPVALLCTRNVFSELD